jgi:hypothetical protein
LFKSKDLELVQESNPKKTATKKVSLSFITIIKIKYL